MKKRNRIILLIDFSKYAENLTEFAFNISEIINAKVVFVHQISGIAPAMADQESRDEIIKTEKEEAYSKLEKLAKGRVYSDDSFHVSPKPILSILKELSSEFYFDWVMAGLKGTGALKRLFIGSTTISIIDESDLLTMAISARSPIAVPGKLMVGIHPKYPLNKQQFNIVLSSLKDRIKHLEFFTVLKEDEDDAKAKQHLSKIQSEYESYHPGIQLFQGDNALSLLEERMEITEDSFLVLQQGARLITDRLFRKFTINELVYTGETPLIVLSK